MHELIPELAMKETRTIIVFEGNKYGVPPAEYALIEMYCNEKDCDCRRVYITVVSSVANAAVAVLTYGWASEKHYVKWVSHGAHKDISELDEFDQYAVRFMRSANLSDANKQSKIAHLVLQMVKENAFQDRDYVDRLKRHYKLFRESVRKVYLNGGDFGE